MYNYVPGDGACLRWMERQPWVHHLRRNRPCTYRTHCPQPKRQPLRRTWSEMFVLGGSWGKINTGGKWALYELSGKSGRRSQGFIPGLEGAGFFQENRRHYTSIFGSGFHAFFAWHETRNSE